MRSSFYYFIDDWVIHSGGQCEDDYEYLDYTYSNIEDVEDCVKFCESGIGRFAFYNLLTSMLFSKRSKTITFI